MKKMFFLTIIISLVLAGCGFPGAAVPTQDLNTVLTAAAATAYVALTNAAPQATTTPLATETLTATLPPPTPTATIEVKVVPVPAQCTYITTVRSWPAKGGDDLGFVPFERTVEVLARNLNGNWYYINWADSPTGKGWVLSKGFTLKGDIARLPIATETGDQTFYLPPLIWEITGTPLPLPTLATGPEIKSATVNETVTIRVCPNKACMALGYLQPGEQINLVGRFGENEWAQFLFPSGPDGKAWVSRDSLQPGANAFSGLPYFDVLGTPITPEPPTSTPDPNMSPTPTPTATSLPVGPLVEITDVTTVYSLMSSLSPVVGTLNPKDRVHVTAESLNHLWFEIQYPDNTDGRAYISKKYARYLASEDYRYVHYTDANGTPIPTLNP